MPILISVKHIPGGFEGLLAGYCSIRLFWIVNPNPKSDSDFGLSIKIKSTKLDCNPD